MDFSRLNIALWNYYKIQDKQAEIAHVKQQLSSPPQASPSATTGNSSGTSATSEKGTQADRNPSAVSKKLF
jgi:hypothetical protein